MGLELFIVRAPLFREFVHQKRIAWACIDYSTSLKVQIELAYFLIKEYKLAVLIKLSLGCSWKARFIYYWMLLQYTQNASVFNFLFAKMFSTRTQEDNQQQNIKGISHKTTNSTLIFEQSKETVNCLQFIGNDAC